MSIIQDALKKAQEDRAKKNKREVPYHLSGVQKKSKTIVYAVVGLLCVAAVIAYLYIPYFHKPKQIVPPVVAQAPATVTVNVIPVAEAQKSTKETSGKKGESTIVLVPQNPIEKRAVSVILSNKQVPADAKTRIAQVPKDAIAPLLESRVTIVEPAGKQDAMNEPMRNEPMKVAEKIVGNGDIDIMYNQASREQQTGRIRDAKTIYKQILARQPGHIETLNNLGVIAIYEGNTQEALLYFKRILEYRKNYSKAYNNIGLIAMKDGDHRLAEEYLRKAISLEPDDPGPYVNLSALLRSQGRLQEAAKLVEIPIQKKAKDPDLLLSYAVIKDNLGQYEEAARYYRQYLSSIQTPASRKDIIERLQYIEGKIISK